MRTIRAERVEFDSTKKIREDADAVVVPAILTRESILPFADGKGYRSAKELKDSAWTLEGAWMMAYKHISTVFPVRPDDIRGRTQNVSFDASINGIRGEICFIKARCDEELLNNVRQGNLKDVSVAYFCDDIPEPGTFAGEPYDFVQRNFMFGHVAAGVPEGRCPSPFCGMNVDSFKPRMDPEETEEFVHIRVRDPEDFVEGSFRTIEIDAEKGIKAVIGKLKSDPQGSTKIQKFIFDKSKDWTMEKAQAWVKEHKDSVLPSASKSSDVRDDDMTPEEIDAKIAELQRQRDDMQKQLDEVYEKYRKQDLKLQNKIANMQEELQQKINALWAESPNVSNDPKYKELWNQLENINGEIEAFRQAKVKAEIGSGDSAGTDTYRNLDPVEVLARSRSLLNSQ